MVKLIVYLVGGLAALTALVMGTWIFPFTEVGTGSRWGNWAFGFDFSHNDVGGALTGLLAFGFMLQLNPLRWSLAGGVIDEHPDVKDFRFEFGPVAMYGQFDGSVQLPDWVPFL